MLRALYKRSSIYFLGLTVGKLSTTAVFLILARLLSLPDFGRVMLFSTLITVITFIGDFGLVQWYQKTAEETDRKTHFQRVVQTRGITLVFSMILTLIFLRLTNTFDWYTTTLFVLLLISEAFTSVPDGYYLENQQSFRVSLKQTSKMLVQLVFLVVILRSFTFINTVYAYIAGSVFTLLWYFPWKTLTKFASSSLATLLKTLKGSSHYSLLTVTSYAYSRGDSILINYLLNSSALGLYGAAYRYLESFALLPTALSHNLFPISARKQGITIQQLQKIMLTVTAAGCVVAVCILLLAPFLTVTILGSKFAPAIVPLRIFSLVILLFFMNGPLSTVVQSSHLLKRFLPFGMANTLLNLALNAIVIPFAGINGAAWVMLTTEITGFCINLYFVKKLYS